MPPLKVNLNDSIAILLIELKDPTVEIVAVVSDIGRVHSSEQYETSFFDLVGHQRGFNVIVGCQGLQELAFFLFERVLIGASVAEAKKLYRFSGSVVLQGHMHPGPLV